MGVAATVTTLLFNFSSLVLGATVNIYLLKRAFMTRNFIRNNLLEVNIVTTGTLVCAGIVPLSLLRHILSFHPNFSSEKICFIENFCRTLSYNCMLMTLIFFSVHRIQRVKIRSATLKLSTVHVVEVSCAWIVGGISACFGFVTSVHESANNPKVLDNDCVPLLYNSALVFQAGFMVCLFSVLMVSLMLCWVFIIKYIQHPFRIEPNDSLHSHMEHTVINTISGTCDNGVYTADANVSSKRSGHSSGESQMSDIPSRYGSSVRPSQSYDHEAKNYDHAEFSDILSSKSSSLRRRRSTFSRSQSEKNFAETRGDKWVINRRSFQKRSKSSMHLCIHGKISDSPSVSTYKSVLSRHSSSLKSYLDFFKSESRRLTQNSSLNEVYDSYENDHDRNVPLQTDVCKTAYKSHYDSTTFHQKDHSMDSQCGNRENVYEPTESYASSITSSHIEFHILEKRLLQVSPDSSNNMKTKTSFGSCSSFGDTDGLSLEKEFFSDSRQSGKSSHLFAGNSDHSFSPLEKVHCWKQNNFCNEDEISNDTSFCPNMCNISMASQSVRMNESRTSSRIPVQIKITRPSTADNQLKIRRNAFVQTMPLLQINPETGTEGMTYRNGCNCIPIRYSLSHGQNRNSPTESVSKRMCLSIVVCCLMLPYLIISMIHVLRPDVLSSSGITISNALAEVVFAVNPYLYLLCNKTMMKALYGRSVLST